MKHIFASGEVMYKKNVKELEQGTFTAESIYYSEITKDTVFEAYGNIENQPVCVKFTISGDDTEELSFKFNLKILLQSELFDAKWESYEVGYM